MASACHAEGRGLVSTPARRGNGAGRGGPARGYSWEPFAEGNAAAVRHGAHSTLLLAPRAEELADELRSVVPAVSDADEPMIRLLALILARIEVANDWLVEHGLFRDANGEPQPILRVLSTWENSAARIADRL